MPPRARSSRIAVADRLHSAAIHLLRTVREVDESSGLSPARLSVMSVLVFARPQTLGDLARIEQVSPPSMSRLVRELEDDGLVRRRTDPDDGRVVWIHPTRRGTRRLERARTRRLERLAAFMRPLPRRDVETLSRAAGIVERILGGARDDGKRKGEA